MEPTQEEPQIDTNLYSRQIGTFGMEAMGKLVKMDVLIIGLRGLGVETAKNLILAGPRSVTLVDDTPTQMRDLGANFYLTEEHVQGGATRAQGSVGKLSELNPYVKVEVTDMGKALDAAKSGAYGVVCQTELFNNNTPLDPEEVNAAARAGNAGYISAAALGAWGYCFVDFGETHTINDQDGEQTKQFVVSMIEKGQKTVVTVHEDKRHSYQEGDYVVLREVDGMTEINDLEPKKIIDTRPFTFTLDLDSTGFSDYKINGTCENVKVPSQMKFHDWKTSLADPVASSADGMLPVPDLAKFGRSEQLHSCLKFILGFLKTNGKFPDESNLAQANDEIKAMDFGEFDEEIIKKAVQFCQYQTSPLAAYFGGIVAQEIVKKTGKYSPLKQWLHFDIFETLPRGEVTRSADNSRYADQIAIYGNEVQEKLQKINLFMIGAGALGCELVKAFALMGIGCSNEGKVHITDNDSIEVSNLNRQFLFRANNVGKPKSATAGAIAATMNPQLNVEAYQNLVSPDTEDFFNDKFWESLTFVVNAVDNVKARLYVDKRCAWYELPLFESGTLGTKANSQMIIPHVTQTYGDSQDPPEDSIPMCTLRNFPNLIEHCIEWGRDKFTELFVDGAADVVGYLENPKAFLTRLKTNETSTTMIDKLSKNIKLMKMKQGAKFEDCVKLAKEQFNHFFDYEIRNLQLTFPKDAKTREGAPFWSGPKRYPDSIQFDPNNELHINFILPFANLVAANLGVAECRDVNVVRDMAASIEVAAYKAAKVHVKLEGEEEKKNEEPEPATEEDGAIIEKLTEELAGLASSFQPQTQADFTAAEFEKDDDSNFHIDFINATANLRASNYQIKNCDRNKTKMIAGKIIPAIATTTAMITGAVTAEIYKVVQGYTKIEDVRNGFINLALPLFLFSEPSEVNKIKDKEYDPISMAATKVVPGEFTIYDKITINEGSLTLQAMIDHIDQKYNCEVTLVAAGDYALYNSYLPGNKHAARLPQKIEAIYEDINQGPIDAHKNYLVLQLAGTVKNDPEDADFSMPPIKYVFRA